MLINVKVGEAKTRLSELLAKVEAGDEVIISRGNDPVAKLVPINDMARRHALFEAVIKTRDSGRIETVTVDEIIAWKNEGRP